MLIITIITSDKQSLYIAVKQGGNTEKEAKKVDYMIDSKQLIIKQQLIKIQVVSVGIFLINIINFKKQAQMFSGKNNECIEAYIQQQPSSMVHYGDHEFSAEEFGSLNDGLWNQDEVFKFIAYLLFNKEALKLKLQRRTSKVFKQMSVFIKTRTSVQCRSQNQRLFRKYKNLRNILTSFKEQYGPQRFEQEYSRVINDQNIKFKTEYENYIQQQAKKACEVSTQTQQEVFPTLSMPIPASFFGMTYSLMPSEYGSFPNWVIIPYCS